MTTLDDIDKHILFELQREGRLTNQELADRIGLSPSPCLRRVRALEQAGVISGYEATVDQSAVGLSMTAFVRLKLASHATEVVAQVEQRIREMPEAIEAYLLAGDQDYLVKIVADSFRSYESFVRDHLRTIPSLASIETTFAFGVVKPPAPLPLD